MCRVRARIALIALVLAMAGSTERIGAQKTAPTPSGGTGSYRIAGIAVDAGNGQPIGHAQISIESEERKTAREVYATGDDGRFLFEGLAPGRYSLKAQRRGYVDQGYKMHGAYQSAVVVGPGLKTDELRFAIAPGATIMGRVVDEQGEAVRTADIVLLREVATGRGSSLEKASGNQTNDLGAYRFSHLMAGSYVIAVVAHPWYAGRYGVNPTGTEGMARAGDLDTDVVYPVTFYPGAMDAESAGRIALTPGESVTANVALAPIPGRHVTIEGAGDESDQRMNSFSAVQYVADGIVAPMRGPIIFGNDSHTTELIGLLPGRVDLTWTTGSGQKSQEHFKALDLSENGNEKSGAATVVRGVLEVENGTKMSGVTVSLGYPNQRKPFTAVVGEKGEFEFREEMIRGFYSVEVPQLTEDAVGVRAKGARASFGGIEIQPGRDVELKITAGRAARVSGHAMRNGTTVDGALVALVPDEFNSENNLMRVDQSNSDGSFELSEVVPGKYTLIAVENGWDGDWRSAEFLGRFVNRGKRLEIGAGAGVNLEIEAEDGK